MGWFLYDNGLRHERVNVLRVSFVNSSMHQLMLLGFRPGKLTIFEILRRIKC